MRNSGGSAQTHGTTVLCVRKDNKVVLIADGQVTMGDHVLKHTARKTRRLFQDKVLAGFAGSTADAISLFERFEGKLQEHSGNLQKASVELAKEWRKDRALRHLEALLIVADAKGTFVLSGNGDVIEPDDGLCAIGSGGMYALSAARALLKHSKLSVKDLAQEAMRIASEICIYTNGNFTMEEL
ncbi:MAG TPA: ATP-dependent protease subunit HslV [Dongiaceae bacterium]|nr:ATP-dependent protease subunit HslV [Dongiaceae bacterium]